MDIKEIRRKLEEMKKQGVPEGQRKKAETALMSRYRAQKERLKKKGND